MFYVSQFKSVVILAKALSYSFHFFIIPVLSLIIYYMFNLCAVYLFKSSLLGSTLLSGCLSLHRPALRPGSTGQLLSRVVSSRHFGPSSRILAGPVSGEIGFSYCDLSYSFCSYVLSIFTLLFLRSVCSVVIYVAYACWSSSGTVVSSSKSSALESPLEAIHPNPSPPHPLRRGQCSQLLSRRSSSFKSSSLEAFHTSPSSLRAPRSFKSSRSANPLEAAQGCTNRWVAHPNPSLLLYDQIGRYHASKSSTSAIPLEAQDSNQVLHKEGSSFKSSTLEIPLEATSSSKSSTSVAPLEAQDPSYLSTQVLYLEAPSLSPSSRKATPSTPIEKEHVHQALQLEAAKTSSQEAVQLTLSISLRQRNLHKFYQSSFLDHGRRSDSTLASSNRASANSISFIQAFDEVKAPATTTSSEDVDTLLSTVQQSENKLLYSLGTSQAPAAEDFCQTTGKSTTASLSNALSTSRELGEQLLYPTNNGLADFHSQLDAYAINKRVSELSDLLCLFTFLRNQWQTANQPDPHPNSTSLSSHPVCHSISGNNYFTFDLPRLTGYILDWDSLCISYKEINPTQRLHYLRELYKRVHHPFLLCSTTGVLNFCLNVVTDLINTTQKLHDLLCTTSLKLPGCNDTRTYLSRLLDSFKSTISSLKLINHVHRNSFLSFLVCYIIPFEQQAARTQHTARETAVTTRSQTVFILTSSAETLSAAGAPSSVNAFNLTLLKNSTKTDKNHHHQLQQMSQDGSDSTPSPSSNSVAFKLERHSVHFCSRQQNLILNHPQQLPDALLWYNQVHLQSAGCQQLKARAYINQNAGLSSLSNTTIQAVKLTLETFPTLSPAQRIDCKDSQHSNSLSIRLHIKLNIRDRPAAKQTVIPNILKHLDPAAIMQTVILHFPTHFGQPVIRQTITLNPISQQLSPVDDYLHLLDLQPATNTSIILGRMNISLEADFYLFLPEAINSITTPDVNPGAPNNIPGCANTGTTKALISHHQRNFSRSLLSNSSNERSNNSSSDFSLADPAVNLGFLLPSLTELQLEPFHSMFLILSNSFYYFHSYRQQTILSRSSDCHPPGENSSQAVLSTLTLSQQPWGRSRTYTLSWRDGPPSLSSTQPFSSLILTGSDSVISKFYYLAHSSMQNCNVAVHPSITLKESTTPVVVRLLTFLEDEPPLLSVYPGLLLQQSSQKKLLRIVHFLSLMQPLQAELLEQFHPVFISVCAVVVNLGTLTLTYFSDSFHTDWCCSTFIYNRALRPAEIHCVHPMIYNHQTSTESSMPTLHGAERDSTELWLLDRAKLHFNQISTTTKRRRFSKFNMLQPWHSRLMYYQTLTAGRVPATSCIDAEVLPFHLTLCYFVSLFPCTTGINILLLSARRLSRMVFSNFYWRFHCHLHHLLAAEYSNISNHGMVSSLHYSSIPMDHTHLFQCPSTESPPQLCCSWPDSKVTVNSTSEANTFSSNPEETSPVPWRFVSTQDLQTDCSSKSKSMLYLTVLHLQVLSSLRTSSHKRLPPSSHLQPSMTAKIRTCSRQGLPLSTLHSRQGLLISITCSFYAASVNTLQLLYCQPQLDLCKVLIFRASSHRLSMLLHQQLEKPTLSTTRHSSQTEFATLLSNVEQSDSAIMGLIFILPSNSTSSIYRLCRSPRRSDCRHSSIQEDLIQASFQHASPGSMSRQEYPLFLDSIKQQPASSCTIFLTPQPGSLALEESSP